MHVQHHPDAVLPRPPDPLRQPFEKGLVVLAAFRLDRIVPLRRSDGERRPDYVYELYTHGGSRVVWGRAPGAKSPGEPSVAEKLQFLDSWVKRHGTLEGTRGPQEIDVPYLLKRGRTAGRAAPDRR